MARGRKPLAPEVHEAKGTFNVHPERRNKRAPKSDNARPRMPDDFDAHEKKKWGQLCKILEKNRVMSTDLVEILTAYCTAYGGWMKARESIKKTGLVLIQKTENGTEVKRNPFCVELHKYRDQMNKLLPELGLTPASRGKVSALDLGDDKAEDPFIKIMERMGRG